MIPSASSREPTELSARSPLLTSSTAMLRLRTSLTPMSKVPTAPPMISAPPTESTASSELPTESGARSAAVSESAITWREAVESLLSLPPLTASSARSAVWTSPLMMSSELIVLAPPGWVAVAVPLRATNSAT